MNKAAILGQGDRAIDLAAALLRRDFMVLLLLPEGKEGEPHGLQKRILQLARDEGRRSGLSLGNCDDHGALLRHSEILFECLPEDPAIKQDILGKVARWLPEKSLLASLSYRHTLVALKGMYPNTLKERLVKLAPPFPVQRGNAFEIISERFVLQGPAKQVAETLSDIFGWVPVPVLDRECPLEIELNCRFISKLMELMENGFSIEELDLATAALSGTVGGGVFRSLDKKNPTQVLRHFEMSKVLAPEPLRLLLKSTSRSGIFRRTLQGIRVYDLLLEKERDFATPELNSLSPWLKQASRPEGFESLPEGDGRMAVTLHQVLRTWFELCSSVFESAVHRLEDFDLLCEQNLGWSRGPFRMWDQLGCDKAEALLGSDWVMPDWMRVWRKKQSTLYYHENSKVHCPQRDGSLSSMPCLALPMVIVRKVKKPLAEGDEARLWDLGDGCCFFEIQTSLVTPTLVETLGQCLAQVCEHARGLLIGTSSPQGLVGLDTRLLAALTADKKFAELENLLKRRQILHQSLKYSPIPVIYLCRQGVLGAGAELAMHCDKILACPDAGIGFNEALHGLLPCGGGMKELLRLQAVLSDHDLCQQNKLLLNSLLFGEIFPIDDLGRTTFQLGERWTTARSDYFLVAEGKREFLYKIQCGYRPPLPDQDILIAGADLEAALKLHIFHLEKSGNINTFQYNVGLRIARALSAGHVDRPARVDEEFLLELERQQTLELLTLPQTLSQLQQPMGFQA